MTITSNFTVVIALCGKKMVAATADKPVRVASSRFQAGCLAAWLPGGLLASGLSLRPLWPWPPGLWSLLYTNMHSAKTKVRDSRKTRAEMSKNHLWKDTYKSHGHLEVKRGLLDEKSKKVKKLLDTDNVYLFKMWIIHKCVTGPVWKNKFQKEFWKSWQK